MYIYFCLAEIHINDIFCIIFSKIRNPLTLLLLLIYDTIFS